MKKLSSAFLFLFLLNVSSIQAQILREYIGAHNIPTARTDMNIGDFNGDGFLDMIVPSNPYPLALNDGTGHFFQDYSMEIEELGIGSYISKVGDLDGDGDLDLVTATGLATSGAASKSVKIYFNDGLGNLVLDNDQILQGLADGDLEIADINQDGHLDIFHTGVLTGPMRTYFYLNDGNGQFTLETQEGLIAMCEGDAALNDINGDGAPDLIITGITMFETDDLYSTQNAYYYINNGEGYFEKDTLFDIPNVVYAYVGVVDIDQDNDEDLVLLKPSNNNAYPATLFLNNGSGKFNDSIDLPVSITANAHFEFGDLNNDGNMDMVLMGDNTVEVLLNNGDYTFEVKENHNIKKSLNPHFKLLDADNNGTLDLVQAFDSGIYYNDGEGNFDNEYLWFRNLESAQIKNIDINGDGYPDIIHFGVNQDDKSVVNIHINSQDAHFEYTSTIFEEDSLFIVDAAAVHLNEDQDIDLILLTRNNSGVGIRYLINQNNGSFTEANIAPFDVEKWYKATVKDLNEDGVDDIILSGENSQGNVLSEVYQGLGSGSFSKVKTLDLIIESIEKLHINDDNIIDFAFVAGNSLNSVSNLYTSLGTNSWDSFLDQQELLGFAGFFSINSHAKNLSVIEDELGLHILLKSNVIRHFTQDESGSFIQNFSTIDNDVNLIYTGDLNLDERADYIYALSNDSDYSITNTVVNIVDGELIDTDSIFGPLLNLVADRIRDEQRADFDQDGDMDLLILKSDGELSYLVNQRLEPNAIFETAKESSFTLFPNPTAQSSINIQLPEDWQEEKHYMIFDQSGRLVQRGALKDAGQQQQIELIGRQAGLYSILIYSRDRRNSQTFFIQQN